ncbi:MAG: hypothetical protein IKD50_14060 [Clostridia bacterium]|nr:hypothetical protein [Clostridia bacterium]
MISTSDFAYSKTRADIRKQMCVALEDIKKLASITVGYLDMETMNIVNTQMDSFI